MSDEKKLTDFMKRLADDPNAKPPEGMHVHISKTREPCDHEWNNQGCNPTHCLKCGIDIMTYAMTECP
jgi:hypothetical protein